MIFHDSIQEAKQYGRDAVKEMTARNIPATPDNYAVWYAYVSGRDPDLSRMISILDGNGQSFTAAICSDLYNKSFASGIDEAALNATTDRIESEMKRILSYVGEAGQGAANYSTTLATAHGDILDSKNVESLTSAVTKVLTETRKMEEMNKNLEHQLANSTDEIGQLRDDLEDMRKEAMTDALTGIANRKLFDMELRDLAKEAQETGDELSLLMLDIDHFKKFNDTYGHQTGDQVLKLLASTMTKTVKGDDIPARYGGEEFCVILPGTNLKDATAVAENIRQRVSSKTLVNRTTKEDLGKLTISIGVGQFDLGESLADLIKRADQALYEAKHSGRDCVKTQNDIGANTQTFN
ncbi:MAG: GGDEF domain-containing protein [Rhodospirillaceae bacterium]|nr:MAG: GGDEF domain-containing protein [Rhodospirillaceae bacterium]